MSNQFEIVGAEDYLDIAGLDDDFDVGALDIVGFDDDFDVGADLLVGASPRVRQAAKLAKKMIANRAAKKAAAVRRVVAAKRADASLAVREQEPTRSRRQPLGMNSTGTVAANAQATITARPQTMAFKPDRLIIPATIAPMFTVDDIKVGNRSQLPQNGSLPGEAFLPNTEGAMLDFDTCQTSQDLILLVTNISGGALQFRACFYGKSLES